MRMKGLLCVVVALASAAILVSAFEPVYFSNAELSRSDQKAAEGLSEYFAELDNALKIKLPDNNNPEDNMKVVKELLGSTSSVKVPKEKNALKLLAGLDVLKHECSHKSYLVYAKNHIVNMALEEKNHATGGLRTRTMLDHYQRIHSQHCGFEWRYKHAMRRSQVDFMDLGRVDAAFKDIRPYDFTSSGDFPGPERRQLLAIQLPELSASPIPNITRKIGEQIMNMFFGTNGWESLKAEGSFITKPSRRIFDKFLFKPCAYYEKMLGEILNHARLDAMAEKEGKQFLADSENLYQAMVNSRICKQVLEERSKLYKVFADIWFDNIKQH